MWSDWQPDVVDRDLATLAQAGLKVVRVFPLWPDFQPLHQIYSGGGHPKEIRHGENPFPDDEAGLKGIDPKMISRFGEFLTLAQKHNLKVIVALINGWMSGRFFVPPALNGKNAITDPASIMWQVRFVNYFVKQFKNSDSILAWEPGNECNCMGSANRHQAWVWMSSITHAIRATDSTRPVISGMHSLLPGAESSWTIQDQAELADILTTHPYPIFTPYCDQDPVNTIRPCLHATAESRMYGDIGDRTAFAEEVGTLGPNFCSDKIAADYLRTILFSLWANECHGLLWWCGFDLAHLTHAPYDWDSMERELGLIRTDKSHRPTLAELGNFQKFIEKVPFSPLPKRITDAVCILTENQDHWAVAYSAFTLAKQAGIDIKLQFEDQALKDAPIYLVPAMSSTAPFRGRRWAELLNRVRNGATLYISFADAFFSEFEELTGLEVQTRQRRTAPADAIMDGIDGNPVLAAGGPLKLTLKPTRAQVLGRESDGNPAFSLCTYGKGKVFFLNFPMEMELAKTPGIFQKSVELPYWKIYKLVAESVPSQRVLAKNTPNVGLTEHPIDAATRVVVAINYSPDQVNSQLTLQAGWEIASVFHGSEPRRQGTALLCDLPANDAIVFTVRKAKP